MKTTIRTLAALLSISVSAQWTYHESVDDFNGDRIASTISGTVLGEPYGRSYMGVNCYNGKRLNVYFSFRYLNLNGGTWVSGRRVYRIEIKLDDEVPQNYRVFEQDDILFMPRESKSTFARKMQNASRVAIRLHYYKDGKVTIRYGMRSAKTSVGKVLAACNL